MYISECDHCNRSSQAYRYPLLETHNFTIVCDAHPLIEGHILIIPKDHISCVGSFSSKLYSEFIELYKKCSHFIKEIYGYVSSFEHGVMGQTVFHAHVHLLPFIGNPERIVPEGSKKLFNLSNISEVKKFYEKEKKFSWVVDTSIGAPRFFRDRFAKALCVPERGNWKTMSEDIQYMKKVEKENTSVVDKWNIYLHK